MPHAALQVFGSDGLILTENSVACPGLARQQGAQAAAAATTAAAAPAAGTTAGPTAGGDVSGHLDSVDLTTSGGTLVGWAVDPQLGPIASTVTVRIDGAVVATALADGPRPDLVPKIASSPNHGFRTDASIIERRPALFFLGHILPIFARFFSVLSPFSPS